MTTTRPREFSGTADNGVFYYYKMNYHAEWRGEAKIPLAGEEWYVPEQHWPQLQRTLNRQLGCRGEIGFCPYDGWHWQWPIRANSAKALNKYCERIEGWDSDTIWQVIERFVCWREEQDRCELQEWLEQGAEQLSRKA